MIDFIKYELKNVNPDNLENNVYLDFHIKVNTKTGQLSSYMNAYYKGLEFKIYESTTANPIRRITVEGSLHKFWNNGAHNFNDFGIVEITSTLKELKAKFRIDPKYCILKQLELGVNINPSVKSKTLLKQCLLHKTDRLKWVYTTDEGNYIQAKHQRHILKIYDKMTHYKNKGFDVKDEVLRIEMKYLKMAFFHNKNIYTLQDLLQYGLDKFTPQLLSNWDQVIFYDYPILDSTPYHNTYSSANYWESLSKSNRQYHKQNLMELTQGKPNSLKAEIRNKIEEKAKLLNIETNQINPLYIGLKRTVSTFENNDPNRRFCQVTGLNISMQKADSILLSHTGLKYYYKTDKKVFDEVKRKYLSTLWKDEDYQTQIKEIAHNIRNKASNQKIKQSRLYPYHQKNLFEIAV
ncbi:hypothetical protein [uncultured Christiangramia sp.]|uniref:hypothetical protein n=1 Tax=uncultured Christiangramia sp. TaxID=503836 RepID=UPI00261A5862|nr:hypothetical protein [uncultured Christiangramia sp.]